MDFESPDVEKEFPGLYASEISKRNQESEYSDEEKISKKDLLIGKRREKRDSKKDKGYVAFEGESSDEATDETSPGKSKKLKTPFKFPGKDKKEKSHKLKKDDDAKDVGKGKETKDGKKKKEKKSKLAKLKEKKMKAVAEIAEEYPVFGVPLHLAIERSKCHDGVELPAFFRECVDYIEEHGLSCEGIYRISGVKSKVQLLKTKYNQGERVYLYEHEPHTVASLIKQFLREIPDRVLTQELNSKFEDAAAHKDVTKRTEALKKLIDALPSYNQLLLCYVFAHMTNVIKMEKINKMSLQNVIIVLGPTMQISHHVLQAFFSLKDVLFKYEIKRYQPIKAETSVQSLELPDTPATIEDELGRQESFLNQLHAELNTGLRDKQKEEQLWEIQRIVTQLKRKLRFLRQPSLNKASTEELPTSSKSNLEEPVIDTRLIAPKPVVEPIPKIAPVPIKKAEEISPLTTTAIAAPKTQPLETIRREEVIVEAQIHDIRLSKDEVDATIPKTTEVNAPSTATVTNVAKTGEIKATNVIKSPVVTAASVQTPIVITPPKAFAKSTEVIKDDKIISKLQHPDLEYRSLWLEEQMLILQEEEFLALNRELQRKLVTERMEIERLKGEISDYQQIFKYKQYSIDSSENSSDSESSESQDEDGEEEEDDLDLQSTLQDLLKENQDLEVKNTDLTRQIRQERDACMAIKVEIKLMQQLGQPFQHILPPTRL